MDSDWKGSESNVGILFWSFCCSCSLVLYGSLLEFGTILEKYQINAPIGRRNRKIQLAKQYFAEVKAWF